MSKTECPCCGELFDIRDKGGARSVPQIRRYFALIRAALHHWPEEHEVQFDTEDECRKWLQMKAGYRTIACRIDLSDCDPGHAVTIARAAIKAAGEYAVAVPHNGELVIFTPQSIAFAKMQPAKFNELVDRVEKVIEGETGLVVAELIEEHANAA